MGPIASITAAGIYMFMTVGMVTKSFSLIHVIPDKILSWMNGHGASLGGEIGGELSGQVAKGAGLAGLGLDHLSQRAQSGYQTNRQLEEQRKGTAAQERENVANQVNFDSSHESNVNASSMFGNEMAAAVPREKDSSSQEGLSSLGKFSTFATDLKYQKAEGGAPGSSLVASSTAQIMPNQRLVDGAVKAFSKASALGAITGEGQPKMNMEGAARLGTKLIEGPGADPKASEAFGGLGVGSGSGKDMQAATERFAEGTAKRNEWEDATSGIMVALASGMKDGKINENEVSQYLVSLPKDCTKEQFADWVTEGRKIAKDIGDGFSGNIPPKAPEQVKPGDDDGLSGALGARR